MKKWGIVLFGNVLLPVALFAAPLSAQEAPAAGKMPEGQAASEETITAIDNILAGKSAVAPAETAAAEPPLADDSMLEEPDGEEAFEDTLPVETFSVEELIMALESRDAADEANSAVRSGCPMKEVVLKAALEKTVVPTPDGGVIIVTGNRLIKYDQYLNVIKDTDIPVDVEGLRQTVTQVMAMCPMGRGCAPTAGGMKSVPGLKVCPIAVPKNVQDPEEEPESVGEPPADG